MAPDSTELAKLARHAAESVSDNIAAAFAETPEFEYKTSESDPVTQLDRCSEERIVEILRNAVPNSTVIGEEFGLQAGAEDDESSLRWHIDPIDGTQNFVNGIPYFSTSIGAEVDGSIVAGAVHDPFRKETFWADRTDAWVDDTPMEEARARHSLTCLMTLHPFAGMEHTPENLAKVNALIREFGMVRAPGSFALQLAHVAAGRASATFELRATDPWDIAGGMALVQSAGCTVLHLEEGVEGFGPWSSRSYAVARSPETADHLRTTLLRVLE